MISFHSRVLAQNVPGPFNKQTSYVLFPDSEDENKFYVLPELPNFYDNNGKPNFSLIWYYGNTTPTGGICTLQVALQLPNLEDTSVMEAFTRAVTSDKSVLLRAEKIYDMVKARIDTNDMEAWKKRYTDLGLTEAQANAFFDNYDQDGGELQYMPNSLTFHEIEPTSVSVKVLGFGGEPAHQQYLSGDGKGIEFDGTITTNASGVGSNTAVARFDLTEFGVNLFWHALGGRTFTEENSPPGYDGDARPSVLAVEYTIKLPVMLPEATALVEFKKEEVARLIEEERSSTNVWGHKNSWKEVVGRKHKQMIESTTTFTFPSEHYLNSQEGKKSVQETLLKWAESQLVAMLEAQLPALDIDDLDTNPPGTTFLEALHNDERRLTLSQAIEWTMSPNGMLPKVNDLTPDVPNDVYFQVINMDDRPYVDINIEILAPPAVNFTDNSVHNVIISPITFGGKPLYTDEDDRARQEIHNVTFNDQDRGNVTGRGRFDRNTEKIIGYTYAVTYSDGTPRYQPDPVTIDPQDGGGLYIQVDDLGVLAVTINGEGLPWGVLDRVSLDVRYGDNYHRPSIPLTDEKRIEVIRQPLSEKIDKKLRYKATYFLTGVNTPLYYPADGQSYTEVDISKNKTVYPAFPLNGGTHEYTFALGDRLTRGLVGVEYTLPLDGLSRTFRKVINLPESDSMIAWSVPLPDSGNAQLSFTSARVWDSAGDSHNVPLPTSIQLDTDIFVIFRDRIE